MAMTIVNGKMELIDKVLDKALTTDKARRYYLVYRSILAKYYEHLKNLDLTSLVQSSIDLIDSSLSFKENKEILENFFRGQCLGVGHLDYEHFPREDLENPIGELLEDLETLLDIINELKEKLVRLEREREALSDMLNGLLYVKGRIVDKLKEIELKEQRIREFVRKIMKEVDKI